MKKVILKGLNRRGKSRVSSHGPKFILREELTPNNKKFGENFRFFESACKSFRLGCVLVEWGGWLELGKDVEIVEEID